MNIKNFPPLVLLSKSEQPGREFSCRKRMFMNAGVKGADKLTVSSYINAFLNKDFMNPFTPHPYQDLDRAFYQNIDVISEATGATREELLCNHAEKLKTEIKDLYLAPVLMEEWSKSKQVYKPDPDFAAALLRTQKLQLSREMLTHLPNDYFYIDLSDCSLFDPITGIFVFVNHIIENKKKVGVNISIYLLTTDLIYYSHYFSGIYDEKGIIWVDIQDEEVSSYEVWNPEQIVIYKPEDFQVNRNQVSLFVLQLICYLSIDEPQITPSEYTKNTYIKRAPSQKVKNKWSEVQIHDVGVVYGRTFRKKMKEYKAQEESAEDRETKHHRSPVPHLRSAHWHRYWVGEGRTTLKVNWIEPVFIGARESKNVTIRKVSGK